MAARPMLRSRRILPLAALLAVGLAGGASAIPPGGAVDNPGGAVATVTNSPIAAGGTATFTGTGFAAGEVVTVKIDDGAILQSSKSDRFAEVTAAADGTISGSVDLSKAAPESPVAAGDHVLRFLSGHPRSLRATFQVGSAAPQPSTPEATSPVAMPTTPIATTPAGPVWLVDTTVRRSKTKKKIALKLKAGAFGSAGTVTVTTKGKVKLGKGNAKKRTVAKAGSYFVDKLGSETLHLTLTADGTALLKRSKELKVLIVLKDTNGEDTVKQDAKVTR